MEANNIQENVVVAENTNVTQSIQTENTITGVPVEVPQKKYTFRKLEATDIGLITKLIAKIGVNKIAVVFKSEEVRKLFAKNNVEDESNEDDNPMLTIGAVVVTELVQLIAEAYDRCEADLHNLLSSTSNLSVEEVQKLELGEFFEMLFDFFKKDEFVDFLKPVLKSFGLVD